MSCPSIRTASYLDKLWLTHVQYSKLANQLPGGPDTHTKIVAEKVLHCPSDPIPPYQQSLKAPDVVNTLAESGHVGESVVTALREGLNCYQSVPRPPNDDLLTYSNPCVVATKAGNPSRLEKDFTTKGTQGGLRCPFAKPNNYASENGAVNGVEDALGLQNGDACGHKDHDPIKIEQNEKRSIQTGSTRSSARCPISRCPIRFLDQHSPEEVADYVERHKHEIPRSHAICVSRYQRDSQSMRQLDTKYGSLINMIRGLSVKHQAFLPNGQNGAPASNSYAERVEKWAEGVHRTPRQDMHPATKEEAEEGHFKEERKGHFDRPLREIRVGESPSRPLGIPVPPVDAPPASRPHSPAAPVPQSANAEPNQGSDNAADDASVVPLRETTPNESGAPVPPAPPRRCPFGHGAPQPARPKLEPDNETIRNGETRNQATCADKDTGKVPDGLPQPDPTAPPATIVFNGPVFFGYSPEQTALFLQQLGNLGQKPS